ncbi:MAG TPA: 5'-nucleotidase C-terminal domain-containing protein [Methylomirabilota bacterium]|nr:5'-nucleotidase C-terminal domain-containing protein [Methylomirabilota bacterium]
MPTVSGALRRRRSPLFAIVALGAIFALLVPLGAYAAKGGQTTTIQILDISDWHAQLDPNSGVGGAAALSTNFKADRAANRNTITLTAGDDFGASPPISGFFDEVPSILGQRLMGIQVGSFGNHNFDAGVDHLQEMIDLAGSTDPSVVGTPFQYVSANLINRDANLTGVKDYKIFEFDGVKVAVIGTTNPEAPSLVFPGNFGTIVPSDPAAAAMRAKAAARAEGAKVFVAITHMGIDGRDANNKAFGPLVDFAHALSGFAFVIGDHTNFLYQEEINGALVVENLSKSLSYSRLNLTVRRGTAEVLARSNTFVTPTASAVVPDQAIVDMLAPYREQLKPILGVQLGTASRVVRRADICGRADGRLCESLIGDIVTDAMRAHTGATLALTNSGGLRADLTCPAVDDPADFCPAFTAPPYPITRGQTFGVLPFGNFAVTINVNGAELKAMLEQGFSSMPGANGRFPQVSGMCVTYDIQAAVLSRVTGAVRQAADGTCTGPVLDLTAGSSYTLATNDFTAVGGDGYPNFGSRVTSDGTTLEQALADHIVASTPLTPTVQGRIVCADSNTSIAPACPTILP